MHLKDAFVNAIPRSVKKRVWFVAAALLVMFLGIGVMAKNGWLPSTDPLTGKKTGWLGNDLPKNAASLKRMGP